MKKLLACGLLLLACLASAAVWARGSKGPAKGDSAGRSEVTADNTLVLFESTTMSADITKAAGDPKVFPVPPGLVFRLELLADKKTLLALNKDPQLPQLSASAVQGIYTDLVGALGDAYKEADRLVSSKPAEFDTTFTVLAKVTEAQVAKHITDAQNAAQGVWDKLGQTKKAYKKYKVRFTARAGGAIVSGTTAPVVAFPPDGWKSRSSGDSGEETCAPTAAAKRGLDDRGLVQTQDPASGARGTFDNPNDFVPDRSGPRKRKAVSDLGLDEADTLKRAFALVQGLPADDPRSMLRYSGLHCVYCGGKYLLASGQKMGDIHGNWYFFPFHRAYILFMERTMRKLLMDDANKETNPTRKAKLQKLAADFTLPYWDWTMPLSTASGMIPVPSLYLANGNSTALPNPADSALKPDIGEQSNHMLDVEFWQNTTVDTDVFFGGKSKGGKSYSNAHAVPHNKAGGWMASLLHSSRQPIFYAHHANVDRMWHFWSERHSGNLMPAAGEFKNTYFRFPDETGKWVQIKAEILSKALPGDLGYTYE